MTLHLKKRPFTIDEYHKMGEVGIFENEKVELLNGEIIQQPKTSCKHASHVRRISFVFYKKLSRFFTLGIHDPIIIPKFSEPEPDISVLKYNANFYSERHPHPEDVFILIEVSDSTLAKDRDVKLPIYANAKIKEYWIINLVDDCIEVYKNPKQDEYADKTTFYINDEIELTDFDLKIKVSDILVA